MSSNNEVLNKILELCQDHMDEGNYLKSANLLKKVNELNPEKKPQMIKINRFDDPVKINLTELYNIYICGYIETRHTVNTSFYLRDVIVRLNDKEISVKYHDGFFKLLKNQIKSKLSNYIVINNYLGTGTSVKVDFEEFKDFHTDNIDEDNIYDIQLYYNFVEYASEYIKEYIEIIIDGMFETL